MAPSVGVLIQGFLLVARINFKAECGSTAVKVYQHRMFIVLDRFSISKRQRVADTINGRKEQTIEIHE